MRTALFYSFLLMLGTLFAMTESRVFDFCTHLESSVIDVAGVTGQTLMRNSLHSRLFDRKANFTFAGFQARYPGASVDELKRLSCHTVANSSPYSLRRVEPNVYFRGVLDGFRPGNTARSRYYSMHEKLRYKLAYLVMVHDLRGLSQLKRLIYSLDDGSAIIMIHVDLASPELFDQMNAFLRTYIDSRAAPVVGYGGYRQNVFLAEKRFLGAWGHSSLVHMQLSGFWELSDLAFFDFAINLSNFDYPLLQNGQIHDTLKKEGAQAFIEYFHPSAFPSLLWRMGSSWVRTKSGGMTEVKTGRRRFPRPWVFFKHHQWIMLSRELINSLRTSVETHLLLAFNEFSYIPDEAFFATLLLNTNTNVSRNMHRYLRFKGANAHPDSLLYEDRHDLYSEDLFFARKIKAFGPDEKSATRLMDWADEQRSLKGARL